jgi:nucleotide-binding universal stress UspA family protein
MHSRILLAYDGSLEGRAALREGALVALRSGAQVFLLSVIAPSAGMDVAESAYPGPIGHREAHYRSVLDEGAAKLKEIGFDVVAQLVSGDPAKEIAAFARRIRADLVVVGYRRKNPFARWWSGPSGAYLSDQLECSLLISRNTMSDEEFQVALAKAKSAWGQSRR